MKTTANGLRAGSRVRRKSCPDCVGTMTVLLHTQGICDRCTGPGGAHVLVQWDGYPIVCDEDPKDLEPAFDGEVAFTVRPHEVSCIQVECGAPHG